MNGGTVTPAQPVQWKVTQVVDTTDRDNSGTIVRGKTITYQIAGGPSEAVFVPGNPPTMDQVAEIIRARAANLDGIANLSSGS